MNKTNLSHPIFVDMIFLISDGNKINVIIKLKTQEKEFFYIKKFFD